MLKSPNIRTKVPVLACFVDVAAAAPTKHAKVLCHMASLGWKVLKEINV
jgi:hypothetical protein